MSDAASCRHAYVGLGANLPWQGRPPERTLALAAEALGALGQVEACSGWWRTEPMGRVREQPAFVNGAVCLRTPLAPEALLRALLAIERQFGRVRTGAAEGPRTLDLDLLLMEGPRTLDLDLLLMEGCASAEQAAQPVVIDTPELTLPHPGLARRRFALAPLAQIAPDLRHPGLDATVRELLAGLGADAGAVEPLHA